MLEEEPGALINSIEVVSDPKGNDVIVAAVRTPGPLQPVVPEIREDLRHGLHYLMEGDRFKAQFSSRGRIRNLEYNLRPVGEGTSLVSAPVAALQTEVF